MCTNKDRRGVPISPSKRIGLAETISPCSASENYDNDDNVRAETRGLMWYFDASYHVWALRCRAPRAGGGAADDDPCMEGL